jgi:hypothetical protein
MCTPRRKARQAEVLVLQAGTRLVGADVAGQHDHVGAGMDEGFETGIALEVQVRK